MANDARRVVVTGMGAVTALGIGADALWRGWLAGTSAVVDGEAAFDDAVLAAHVSVRDRKRLDPFAQLGALAAQEALAQARWGDSSPYEPLRTGCIVGTAIGGIRTLEAQIPAALAGTRVNPLTLPLLMANAVASYVAQTYGLRGPSLGCVTACAAGADAIGLGARMIRWGEADAMVCGGADSTTTALPRRSFESMAALSRTGVCRPFDTRRDGLVIGDGAGIVVLETLEGALARGAEPVAEVLGFAQTNDAYRLTAPEPEGRVAAATIELALRDAGRHPADVVHVNAHGTGTKLNDLAEARALQLALGDSARTVPVASLKSTVGHLMGGAGAVEAIAAILALRERVAPATVGLEQPDPELGELAFVAGSPAALRPASVRDVVLSNAFGFGGHNAVLALGPPPATVFAA